MPSSTNEKAKIAAGAIVIELSIAAVWSGAIEWMVAEQAEMVRN